MNLKTRINLLELLIVSSALFLVFLVTYFLISFSVSEIKISVIVALLTMMIMVWPARLVFKRIWLKPLLGERGFSEMNTEDKRKAAVSAHRFPFYSAAASLLGWYAAGVLAGFFIWIFSGMELIKIWIFYGAFVTGGTTASLYQFFLLKRTLRPVLEELLGSEIEVREYDPAFFRAGIRAKFLFTFSMLGNRRKA